MGGMNTLNKMLLHVEGFTVLVTSLYFYGYNQFSWILFVILLFTPDLSMIGYVFNNRIGARLYNLFHTYSLSIAVIMLGFVSSNKTLFAIGLILTAHIGMDRMVGYGLKYVTDFKDTHLHRV